MERRAFLGMGLTGAAGVAVGASGALAARTVIDLRKAGAVGSAIVEFDGEHQPGISTPQAAQGVLVAFDLLPGADRASIERLLRLWSQDARLLQQGLPALADASPELAATPASLSITIGLGRGVFSRSGLLERWPLAIDAIPAFTPDQLDDRWSDGDVLLQVSANDGTTIAHALRELIRDAQPFARVRWRQSGWHAQPDVHPGELPRNLIGFREGAANPAIGTQAFEQAVWNDGAGQAWFAGGTSMVVRRVRIDLARWDQVPPAMQESSMGRYRSTGAPLGGTSEFEAHDLTARHPDGSLVIPADAHIRRADSPSSIFRRPFNYDDGYLADGTADAGLIFIAFGADIDRYLAIQSNLAVLDAMNRWFTHVGSALFVVPPGARSASDWVGSSLFQRS